MDAILGIFSNLFSDVDFEAIVSNLSGMFADFDMSQITALFGDFDISQITDAFGSLF